MTLYESDKESPDSAPIEDIHVNLLCDLGITPIQARVYLAMYSSGESTVRSLVESLGIHRADAYRAIQRLQTLGLIELSIGNPNKYSAIPPSQVVELLSQRLERNVSVLRKKALQFAKTLEAEKERPVEPETKEKEQFFKLKRGDAVIRSILSLVDVAEVEVKEVASTDALRYHLSYGLAEADRRAIRRGVKMNLITDFRPAASSSIYSYFKLVETRLFGDLSESLKFILVDDKIVQIALAARAKVKSEALALTTNNKTLVRSLSNHFKDMWNTSQGMD